MTDMNNLESKIDVYIKKSRNTLLISKNIDDSLAHNRIQEFYGAVDVLCFLGIISNEKAQEYIKNFEK